MRTATRDSVCIFGEVGCEDSRLTGRHECCSADILAPKCHYTVIELQSAEPRKNLGQVTYFWVSRDHPTRQVAIPRRKKSPPHTLFLDPPLNHPGVSSPERGSYCTTQPSVGPRPSHPQFYDEDDYALAIYRLSAFSAWCGRRFIPSLRVYPSLTLPQPRLIRTLWR